MRWLLPTQKQMNRLSKIGLAKPYQRSSKSWQMPYDSTPFEIEYVNVEEIEFKAKDRKQKIAARKAQQQKELESGALPTPAPAEELLDK
jgi:hypothetical protein